MSECTFRPRLSGALALAAAACLACGGTIAAQTSTPSKLPVFDVVSVKLNKSGTNMFRSRYSPGGFEINNTPLLFIVRQAFDLFNSNDDQITGLPDWAKSEHYDIQAKVSEDDLAAYKALSNPQRGLMLQALLADRFKMVAHTEMRELPIYALVVAKGGPKFHEADPSNTYANGLRGPDGKGTGPGMMRMGPTYIEGQAIPIAQLLGLLTQNAGRTVIDKTGLTGKYDISLKWTPDLSSSAAPGGSPAPDAGPSLFTALQEQLGLKLESKRGPVPGVVIDHIERPAEN